ncbi:MAG: DEAD/DEAH box helicase [Phycisphaerales bacterium]|nr:MAG: DEAD/DEAH box helicase [Phycisphaerales bacterium]
MHKHLPLPGRFAELGIEPRFLKALTKMGFTEPTEIQRALIPPALKGRDILGQARTGTGKTAAFGLPLLQQLDPAGHLQAICLAPTRELAVQVTAEIRRLAEFAKLHIVAIYGGQKMATQRHELGRKPHFVVGTPGRVWDFMGRGTLNIEHVRFVVLDEVDRMLDIGFRDDIRKILGRIKTEHQTIFVSATLDEEIKRLASRFMKDPLEVNVSRDHLTVEEVDQWYVSVERHDKFRLLKLILKEEDPSTAIVFCNTKAMVRKLAQKLHNAGVNAQAIEGDLVQRKRDRVMSKFRKHQIRLLVATDLAARGIDVSAITHIINYDIPADPEVYVHRIGRTARMGERGVAITFVGSKEGKELTEAEKLINREIRPKTVKGFEPTPAPEEREEQEIKEQEVLSRFEAPVFGSTDRPEKLPPKTLGSRFRPRRRSRRI